MMRRPGRARSLLLSIVVTCVMAGTGVGRAQQPPGQPRPAWTSAQQAAPPVIQFAAGGIPLEEAVRLTLQSVPAIQRATLMSLSQEGARVEIHYVGDPQQLQLVLSQRDLVLAHGDADWTLSAKGPGQ